MSIEDPSLTVQSLDQSLGDLVEWEGFAIHLPEITQPMIDIIKRDHPGNMKQQKQALYASWLRAYPHATWNNVVYALETAKEISLAEKLRRKKLKNKGNEQKLTEKIDEGVVIKLKRLRRSFEFLIKNVEQRCHELVTRSTISLDDILVPLQRSAQGVYKIDNLCNAQTTAELFDSLSSHYTFLDCDLLESIINDLPNSNDLFSKFDEHQTCIRKFKRESSVQSLREKLFPLTNKARLEEISLKVIFVLEDAWGKKDMSLFETLIETMFPGLSNRFQWYEVVPGSICVTFITCQEDEGALLRITEEKQGFMRLLGIVSVMIGGKLVFEESETNSYSFESSLLESCLSGSKIEALLFLLNVIKVNVNHQGQANETALSIAVKNNVIEVAEILLKAKANPNHSRDDGNTPFHIACYKGYTQLAGMLIEYGANPLITNTKGDTPFLSSIRGNMIEVMKMITPKLPESEIPPALLLACRLGYSNIISFLLQHVDPPNHSVIHQYCANGELALAAEHIVQFNEDINCTVALGITPLMIASSCGHVEVVECLVEANSNMNSIDNDGYSPLAYAITGSKSIPVIEYLLQAGANPSIRVGGVSLLQMVKQLHGMGSDIVSLLLRYMALQLYNMFSSLVEKIREDLTNEITAHKTTLQEMWNNLLSNPDFCYIEGIAEANSCKELFSILQPHYDFLSWKVISLLSSRLKNEGYFQSVEALESDLEIQMFPQVMDILPPDTRGSSHSTTSSSCSDVSLSLDRQWGDKTLFNLRGLSPLLFSSLARVMSHLTVNITQHEITVSYRIPKLAKLIEQIQSQYEKIQVCLAVLGIREIKLNNEVIMAVDVQESFAFESALANSLALIGLFSVIEILKIMKFLVKVNGVVIDYIHQNGATPLRHASIKGCKPVVDFLLSHGADPSIQDTNGITPLISACSHGHFDIVKALVAKCPSAVNFGAIVNQDMMLSPLFSAFMNNYTHIMEFLLENGADPSHRCNPDGVTILMFAAVRQQIEVMKLLLDAGANPNLTDKDNHTALMVSCKSGHVEGVKLLLEYKADYRICQIEQNVPMDSFAYACVCGSRETVDVFLSNATVSDKSLSMGWYIACLFNRPHLIDYLVNSLPQLSVNQRQLITACVKGDLTFVNNNLPKNPDDEFIHGVTPLMVACSCDNISLVKLLLNAGANVTKEDAFGKKVIEYCKNDSTTIDLLQSRNSREPMKQTFDKTKLFGISSQKGLPLIEDPFKNTLFV